MVHLGRAPPLILSLTTIAPGWTREESAATCMDALCRILLLLFQVGAGRHAQYL